MNSPGARFKMFRQHSQRYSRANLGKGLKVKHVLQIGVVVVVLTWVMYEVNLSIKPAAARTGSAVFDEAEQEAFLGRKTLKPDGGLGRFGSEVEKDVATDRDDRSAEEENFDGFRTEEDSDDQRDRDISELDIEHATEQDEKSEDETMLNDAQHDVGTDFEELKNEQARVEQEENRKGGKDGDDDSSSEAQDSEATTSDDAHTEGGSDDADHLEEVVDKEKIVRETHAATFMEAFTADSTLKPKLDILDEGKADNTSRASLDEKRDSAVDPLKEIKEDLEEKVAKERSAEQNEEEEIADQNEEESADQNEEEKSVDQDPEIGEKDTEDGIVETSEDAAVSDKTENYPNNQSEEEDTQTNPETQSEGQSDANREKTEESVESKEEGKTDDEKFDAQSHRQEQEEKKLEVKASDTQTPQETEVQNTEGITQPESKTEGADLEVQKKADESQDKLVQPEEAGDQSGLNREKERLAAEVSAQGSLVASAEKEGAEQDQNSGETKNVTESQHDATEQKKDESTETYSAKDQETQVESKSAEDSDSNVEENTQEVGSAETVNTDSSTQEDPKKDEPSKDEALKQVTDSDAAETVDSNAKTEDQSAEKSNDEVAKTQEGQAQK